MYIIDDLFIHLKIGLYNVHRQDRIYTVQDRFVHCRYYYQQQKHDDIGDDDADADSDDNGDDDGDDDGGDDVDGDDDESNIIHYELSYKFILQVYGRKKHIY